MTSDMSSFNRQLFPDIAIAALSTDCLAGEKVHQDIRSWLSPLDPWKNYNIARRSRHSGTGEWLVKGGMFSEWKGSGPSSLLWIHGKRQSPPNDAYPFAS